MVGWATTRIECLREESGEVESVRTKLFVVLALLALVAVACSDNRTAPTQPGGGDGGDDSLVIAEGQSLYAANCTACHGEDAGGVEGLGKPLVNSPWIQSNDNATVSALIIAGRGVDDPENTTGVAMPARGGNPALTDDEIDTIVVYLRSLN